MGHEETLDQLKSLGNPTIAAHSQRFFKTGEGEYGHGDRFLGIRVPVLRQEVHKQDPLTIDDAVRLLQNEFHEVRLFALFLLVRRFARGSEQERKTIYEIYLNHTRYVNNWDLVDSSAHLIVGCYLESRDKSILKELARSESLWERRIAIMSTFYFIKKNQFEVALDIAHRLLNDPEDLIHKAVGWMLRETGKRDMNLEVDFLRKHYRSMPRTMLRYAIEKFSLHQRHKYLKGEI